MDPAKRKAIAGQGGRTAHRLGRAHQFSHEEAVAAGSKGGKAAANRHKFTSAEARAPSLKGWEEKAENG